MELSPSGEPVEKKPTLMPDGLIQTASTAPTTAATITTTLANTTSEKKPTVTTTATTQESAGGNLTVSSLDIEILPVIYEIIRCVEKDPVDIPSKQRESAECTAKIFELNKRLDSARTQVRQLPGIDYNKEEQQQKLQLLKKQLKLKQTLLQKYRDMEV